MAGDESQMAGSRPGIAGGWVVVQPKEAAEFNPVRGKQESGVSKNF